jgi:serine/threonine protein kinase
MLTNLQTLRDENIHIDEGITFFLNWKYEPLQLNDTMTIDDVIERATYSQASSIYPVFQKDGKPYVLATFHSHKQGKESFGFGFSCFEEVATYYGQFAQQAKDAEHIVVPTSFVFGANEYWKHLHGLIPYIGGHLIERESTEDLKESLLTYLHQLGDAMQEFGSYINMDLNYGNLLSDGALHVIDFVLAKEHERPTGLWNERNDTRYWSPELYSGGIITQKTTVYSAGLIVREMLGKTMGGPLLRPYESAHLSLLWEQNKEWIQASIEEDPENRPSLQELSEHLQTMEY